MTRLTFPDEGSREVKAVSGSGWQNKKNRTATFYTDAGATTLANLLTYPGGAAIAGSAVTIDAYSMLPLFQGPNDGSDLLYVVVDNGPAWPVYARADDRIDANTTAIAALPGTYGPVALTRPGNKWVALGDSTTQGAASEPPTVTPSRGEAWPTYASILSGQRLRLVRNAGLAGDTSTMVLARFDTEVTPYSPNVVTIFAGTNDIGGGIPFATFQANIQAMVAKCVAIRARPVLATIVPRDAGGFEATIVKWNLWLRDYGERNGLTVLDFYTLLTDPTNGHYLAAYVTDGIHPNNAGLAAMGALVNTILAPLTPGNAPFLPMYNTDTNNLLLNGCFLNGTTVATNWTAGSAPTGVTKSLITDPAVPGKMQRIALAAASGLWVQFQAIATGFSAGDVIRAVGVVTADGSTPVTVKTIFAGGVLTTARPVGVLSRAFTRGVFCQDLIVPAGTTSITSQIEVGAAGITGQFDFGQFGLFNLTALGALT